MGLGNKIANEIHNYSYQLPAPTDAQLVCATSKGAVLKVSLDKGIFVPLPQDTLLQPAWVYLDPDT